MKLFSFVSIDKTHMLKFLRFLCPFPFPTTINLQSKIWHLEHHAKPDMHTRYQEYKNKLSQEKKIIVVKLEKY